MMLELSTEEKIIVTILWVFTIFFLVLVSGIFEGGHEPIKPPNIPPPPPSHSPPLLFRRRLRVRTNKQRRYVVRSKKKKQRLTNTLKVFSKLKKKSIKPT